MSTVFELADLLCPELEYVAFAVFVIVCACTNPAHTKSSAPKSAASVERKMVNADIVVSEAAREGRTLPSRNPSALS